MEDHEIRTSKFNKLSSIVRLKKDLTEAIPFVPNNKESKDFLLNLELGDLIHIHDFWQHRLVSNRPRTVNIPSHVRNSKLYIKNRDRIKNLRSLFESGLDVSDFLSRKAKDRALDVNDFKKNRDFIGSRDAMLICEGYHHFHLAAYPSRTDELIIAQVTNDHIDVIGIFTHEIFEQKPLNQEYSDYQKAIETHISKYNPSGGIFIGGAGGCMQNLAGSSLFTTIFHTHTYRFIRIVEENEGGIEAYTKRLYKDLHNRSPSKVKPTWILQQRNLEIYDKNNKINFSSDQLSARTSIGIIKPFHN